MTITFHWSLVQSPQGSVANLADSTLPNPHFIPDLPRDYVFQLVVTDGNGDSAPDQLVVRAFASNPPPNARAGKSQNALVGRTVTLDGSASFNSAPENLGFQWSFLPIPPGSALTDDSISSRQTSKPQFVPDVAGTYSLKLVLTHASLTNEDTVQVFVSRPNVVPNADAGLDQTVSKGRTATLDGRASFDTDNGPAALNFSWSVISRPTGSALTTAALTGSHTPTPSFTADVIGAYLFRLQVSDGEKSAEDNVLVNVVLNQPPVARNDLATAIQGTPFSIAVLANDSDPDEDSLTITSASSPANGTVTVNPNGAITYTSSFNFIGADSFNYTISDGKGGSATARVNITVNPRPNGPPNASDDDASTPQSIPAAIAVLKNDNDPDGDPLSVIAVTQPANGSAVINANGTVTYTPNNFFAGTDTFTYTIGDGRGGTDTATVRVEVLGPPSITNFTPTSGRSGEEVAVTGNNLASVQTVAFNGVSAGGLIVSSNTTLRMMVPSGATTGPISVTGVAGSSTSTGHFVVLPVHDFQISVAPAHIIVPAAGQAAFQISLSGTGGFTDLTSLSVNGAPLGIKAVFGAASLTVGQRTMLTVQTNGTTTAGSYQLTVTATGILNGVETTRFASVTLQVQSAGVTSVVGQILTDKDDPIPNVGVSIGTVKSQSDAAGNFLLENLSAGVQSLGIDANGAVAGYPIYAADVTLTAGETTVLPIFHITPPPPPEQFVPINNSTADQIVTDPRFPGLEVTLPAGVTIVGWEGLPKTKIALDRFNPDTLPMLPPPFPTSSVFRIHFGTPMGGVPSAPIPVTLPNDQDLEPGEKAEIWYYDAAPLPGVPGAWRLAGLGTVSEDGTGLVSDPGVGIERFCGVCGATCFKRLTDSQDNKNPDSPSAGDPVNLALGQFHSTSTDLVLPGRIPIRITRTYNPLDPFAKIAGFQLGLGPGWALPVDVALIEPSASSRRLILPGNSRFDFVRQPDGRFVNTKHPRFAGAVLLSGGGTHQLRFRDGTTWGFSSGWVISGRVVPGLGLLVEQTDPNGNRLMIERNAAGGISRIIEPAGRDLTFALNSSGRITEIQDPIDRRIRYTYNAEGRLETVADAAGGVTRYAYDAAGRILTVTDPKGIIYIRNEYSPDHGRIIRQTQGDGGVWQFSYEFGGGTPTCNGPGCNFTIIGRSIIATTVIDPRGNQTAYRFSLDGFTRFITNSLGQTTQFERDSKGRLVRIIDPLKRATQFARDADGNVTSVTDAAGHVATFTYDSTFNEITSITDPVGNTTTLEYDAKGNLTAITDAEQNRLPVAQRLKIRVGYNQFGQPINFTDPLGNTTAFGYNDQGDRITVTNPLGQTNRRAYDRASRLISLTNRLGNLARLNFDALNLLNQLVDTEGGLTRFAYDANRNLFSLTDSRGQTVTNVHDVQDRIATRTDSVGRIETYSYDRAGNLIRFTDRNGQVTLHDYDALNRRVASSFADGSKSFAYDTSGRISRVTDSASGVVEWQFDEINRMVRETTPLGTITYAYDAAGRRTSMTVSGQSPVTYSYDANSRLKTISQAGETVNLTYDAAGRLIASAYPNGTTTNHSYDAAGRVTRILHQGPFGVIADLRYTYDAAGNRVAIARSPNTDVSLPSALEAAYDSANRQARFNSATPNLVYDGNGNLIADPTTTYHWDIRNRLVGITGPGLNAAFTYDALGRRVSKTVSGVKTDYLYDRNDIVAEFRNGAVIATYLRGLSVDTPFIRRSTSREYYHTDHLGSVIALTNSNGAVETTYSYDPFGTTSVAGQSDNPYQYTGRENDQTGLYYYRARYYSPKLHRFIREDPLRLLSGETNYYAYVSNNPIRFRDPFGTSKEEREECLKEVANRLFTREGEISSTCLTLLGKPPRQKTADEKLEDAVKDSFGELIEGEVIDAIEGGVGNLGGQKAGAKFLGPIDTAIDAATTGAKGILNEKKYLDRFGSRGSEMNRIEACAVSNECGE